MLARSVSELEPNTSGHSAAGHRCFFCGELLRDPAVMWSGAGYLNLKTLATYSSCSIRWLRDRLADRVHPLPHYRVGGKVLVKKEDYDSWMAQFRTDRSISELDEVVNDVLAQMNP
jgi:hypothetical protein